jgi:predicted alpha/beta-hydrolase family hydrolase
LSSTSERREIAFEATRSSGAVSALLHRPTGARCLYVLAHGAGAGMRHPFLEAMCARLAARGVATLRYQFPYMERGAKRPDPPAILQKTVRSALAAASSSAPDLPLLAGGKSMGGRMTSMAAAAASGGAAFASVRGLVFLGFPLHAAGRPSEARGEHLGAVRLPMLFLQGTRDTLADLALLRPVVERLGARATLRAIEGGDHSFHVLRRSGRTDGEVLDELADAVSRWGIEIAG